MKQAIKEPVIIVSLVIFALLCLSSLLAPVLAPFAYDQLVSRPLQGPSVQYWLGTDEMGRDIYSRILYAGRVSMMVGFISTLIAMIGGVLLGLISGFYGGKVDTVISRLLDGLLAFPSIILALAVMAVLGPNVFNAMLAIGVISIPIFARIVRNNVFSLKEREFVEASRSIGARDSRLMLRVILPNCLSPVLVQLSLTFATAVLTEAGLSFLGLGVQPPQPSWGSMLNAGKNYLSQVPLYSIISGGMVFATVMCLNLLGDALRDVFDPRELRKR